MIVSLLIRILSNMLSLKAKYIVKLTISISFFVVLLFPDEGSVYSTHTQRVHIGDAMKDNQRILPSEAKKRFVEFIRAHHEGHIYKYRERLLHNYRKKKYMLTVNLGDLANFDTKLKDLLQVCCRDG